MNIKNNTLSGSKHVPLSTWLFLAAFIIAAFNLRSAITSVGPLIGWIRADTGMSNTAIGLLTTLPLLAFGVFSIVAPKLGRKLGNETVVFLALVVLTAGILLRSTGYLPALFVGTAMIGLGIAICNVLILAIVKEKYPEKMGVMTGVFTTSMSLMAALASGVSIPFAETIGLGWQKALAVWALLSGAGMLVWLPQLRARQKPRTLPVFETNSSLFRSPLAWQVTIFMGFQSAIFYCLIAWLPEILVSRGVDVPTAGWLLTIMQIAGLPATLAVPILAVRLRSQRPIVLAIVTLYLIGFIGLYSGGSVAALTFFNVLLGLGQGAGISLALTLFGLRTTNGVEAANLSGMAQSGGYFLAAIGPIFMGYLFDYFHSWSPAIFLLVGFSLIMIVSGMYAAQDRVLFQKQAS